MPKPPICELLNLDQRKLPAEVFDRISDRAGRLLPRQPARRRADDTLRQPGLDHHPVVYDAVADGHHPQETRRSDHQ